MNILFEEPVEVWGADIAEAIGVAIIMLILVIGVTLIVALTLSYMDIHDDLITAILIAIMIGGFFLTAWAIKNDACYIEGYKTMYKVTFNDDAPLKEIYSKYDINKVEGDIWTITTKEMTEVEESESAE